MAVKAIRGFKDLLPPESELLTNIETIAREVFSSCGLKEIRIPVVEKTALFARGIGEHTDIVEKEMYSFIDRNGDSISLRPEATAGILRAVIEHKLYATSPILKLFTMGPMFRHERPQKGRLRQFHQIDVEILGTDSPLADAEVIWMAWDILNKLELKDIYLEINSLGCPKCRAVHREDLMLYLEGVYKDLCDDCKRRAKTNPLRIFDCKNEKCKELMVRAPLIKHALCPDCADHYGQVLDFLESFNIPFRQNPYLVRGLDYYTRTTFEFIAPGLGAQSTVAAGGRYDGLIKELGGPDIPGIGMAIGAERVLIALDKDKQKLDEGIDIFIAALGKDARFETSSWLPIFRKEGLKVVMSYEDKSLKAQLKQADKLNAKIALIVGEDELDEDIVIIRNMKTSEQIEIDIDDLMDKILELCKKD